MKEKFVNQCVKEKVPVQDEISKWEFQADVIEDNKNCHVSMKPVCDGKKSQSTKFCRNPVCSDKKFQDTKFMWPV